MIPLRVLLIEDSESDAELLLLNLKKSGYAVVCQRVETEAAMRAALPAGDPWDIVISDYHLPTFSAPAALAVLQQSQLDLPFIVVSGTITEEVAIDLLRSGAADYLMKDRLARLGSLVRRELNIAQVRRERKAAQSALQESELRYRKLFDQSPYGVVLLDLNTGQVLEFNTAAHQQLGYTRAEFAGLRISDIEASETPEQLTAHIAQAQAETWAEFETLHRTRQGELRSVHVSTQTLETSGKIVFYSIFHDITEQKRGQDALRRSEARWRGLVNASPAVIAQIDLDGILLMINRTTPKRQKEDVIGTSIYRLLSLEQQERMQVALAHVLRTKAAYTYESRVEYPDGRVIWYHNDVAPVLDGDQVTSFIYNSLDISQQKQTEELLRLSEERYHLIDEASQDMIYSYNRLGKITHANSSLCRWLGLPLEQILGKDHAELGFSQALCDLWDELHHQVHDRGVSVSAEVLAAVGGDEPQYLELVLNPMRDPAGGIIGIAGTVRNIQTRKQAEAQIQAQLAELRRWQSLTLGREERILELKGEINRLLGELGRPPRYASALEVDSQTNFSNGA